MGPEESVPRERWWYFTPSPKDAPLLRHKEDGLSQEGAIERALSACPQSDALRCGVTQENLRLI